MYSIYLFIYLFIIVEQGISVEVLKSTSTEHHYFGPCLHVHIMFLSTMTQISSEDRGFVQSTDDSLQ